VIKMKCQKNKECPKQPHDGYIDPDKELCTGCDKVLPKLDKKMGEDITRALNKGIARRDRKVASKQQVGNLKKQIEAMKCCGNCDVFYTNRHDKKVSPCLDCKRTSTWKTDQKPTEDHWTLAI